LALSQGLPRPGPSTQTLPSPHTSPTAQSGVRAQAAPKAAGAGGGWHTLSSSQTKAGPHKPALKQAPPATGAARHTPLSGSHRPSPPAQAPPGRPTTQVASKPARSTNKRAQGGAKVPLPAW